MPLTLLVLENPWTNEVYDRLSVLPFVEGLARYNSSIRVISKPFYQMDELGYWLANFHHPKRGVGQRIVYIAADATSGRLGGLPDGTREVNFQSFHRLLRRAGRIDGVHLGCCDFGNRENAARILRPDRRRAPSIPCRWVAGYDQSIDWFDSMLVDLVFWRQLLRDPRHDAWKACLRTYKQHPQSLKLGFKVFRNGPGGYLQASNEAG